MPPNVDMASYPIVDIAIYVYFYFISNVLCFIRNVFGYRVWLLNLQRFYALIF